MTTNVAYVLATNSIFVNAGNFGTASLAGDHNGFWNTLSNIGGSTFSASSSPFAASPFVYAGTASGGGYYFLSDESTFSGVANNGFDPSVYADIAEKTTQRPIYVATVTNNYILGPQVVTNDENLGYHYYRMDYILSATTVRTNLNFAAGTVVAWFGQGASVNSGSTVNFLGTASNPCYFVRGNTVDEMDFIGDGTGIINSTNGSTP